MKLNLFFAMALSAAVTISCCTAEKPEWAPAGDRIMTQWGENLDPSAVLTEYPRPQMIRDSWQNLNGLWKYAVTPSDAKPQQMDGNILVPFAIESALSGVGRTVTDNDVLWYERDI